LNQIYNLFISLYSIGISDMPYKRIGKTIYVKKNNRWIVKQVATSIAKAKSALRLLRGVEFGNFVPNRRTRR
jgi:hypothetical protein